MSDHDGTAPTIVDDTARNRFLVTEDGSEAELVYERDGDRFVIVHTGVPVSMGGRGIGGQLVRAAVERAASEGLTVVPWCPFARRWLHEHPEEALKVTIDWNSTLT